MVLNLTRGHPMRIERQHLVVKAVEPSLPFLAHRGFKRARSIARVARRTGDQPRVTEGTHWGMGGVSTAGLFVVTRPAIYAVLCPILLSVPFRSRSMFPLCLITIRAVTITANKTKAALGRSSAAMIGKNPKAVSAPPEE